MNSLIVVFLLTICGSYIFYIFEQTNLVHNIVWQVKENKQKYYDLETVLYYAIAYYKQNNSDIVCPYDTSIKYQITSNIYKAIILFNRLSEYIIDIKIDLYKNSEFYGSASCQIEDKDKIYKLISLKI